MSLVVIAPDMRSLFRYFWLHVPTAPSGNWVPPTERRWLRRTIAIVEVWILVVVCVGLPIMFGVSFAQQAKMAKQLSPLAGQWHLNSATKPYLTGDGRPIIDLFVQPGGMSMVRSSDQVLWRSEVNYDPAKHTLRLLSIGHNREEMTVYAVTQPDPSHLVLTPTGKDARNDGVLDLTYVPLPSHYPLLDRGFHFVNEWGLER